MLSLKNKADKFYYQYHNRAIMTDYEYDILQNYVKNNLQINSKDVIGKKGVELLPIKMWSLNKKNKFLNDKKVLVMDKLDGISCLISGDKAYTRGNGVYGNNISKMIFPKIFDLNKIPKNFQSKVAIKGELVVEKNKLDNDFVNTRSMVCSYVSRNLYNECVKFIAYELIFLNDNVDLELEKQLNILKEWNIETVYFKMCFSDHLTIEELYSQRMKDSFYNIDGLVISYCDMERNAKILDRNPKYMFAYKKNLTEGVETNVIDIHWNCGKSNIYKPTLIIEPIKIDNVTITRVTGHNYSYLISNKIGINSKVEIIRSGFVIPHVHKVITESDILNLPVNSILENNNLKNVDNTNEQYLTNKLIHFFKILGIKGVGPKKCLKLTQLNCTPEIILKEGIVQFLDLKKNSDINIYSQIIKKMACITDKEIMYATYFFGENCGLKKLEKMNLKKHKPALIFLTKVRNFWNKIKLDN